MNILLLCNKVPYPPNDGGALAILNLATGLAEKGHSITILAMKTEKHDQDINLIPEELRAKIRFLFHAVNTRIKPLHLLLNFFFSRQPYNAVRFHNMHFAQQLEMVLESETFDIVQLEGLYLKWFIPFIRKHHKGKLVYRAHNIETEIWEGIAKNRKNPLEKIYLKNLARRLRKYEKTILNEYDILLPISENDSEEFARLGNQKPVHVTHMNIPEKGFLKKYELLHAPDLYFIGALDWIPNQEALLWFLDEVWEPLKAKFNTLEFHIAGRNAPEWLADKLNASTAVFHGEVENAYTFFDQHTIMVVPLFSGSGLRIKILEAMARSRVVITTTKGAQGLPVMEGEEILISNTATETRALLEDLLKNPDKIQQIRIAAFEFAKQNFSNSAIVDKLLYFYAQHGLC